MFSLWELLVELGAFFSDDQSYTDMCHVLFDLIFICWLNFVWPVNSLNVFYWRYLIKLSQVSFLADLQYVVGTVSRSNNSSWQKKVCDPNWPSSLWLLNIGVPNFSAGVNNSSSCGSHVRIEKVCHSFCNNYMAVLYWFQEMLSCCVLALMVLTSFW